MSRLSLCGQPRGGWKHQCFSLGSCPINSRHCEVYGPAPTQTWCLRITARVPGLWPIHRPHGLNHYVPSAPPVGASSHSPDTQEKHAKSDWSTKFSSAAELFSCLLGALESSEQVTPSSMRDDTGDTHGCLKPP